MDQYQQKDPGLLTRLKIQNLQKDYFRKDGKPIKLIT